MMSFFKGPSTWISFLLRSIFFFIYLSYARGHACLGFPTAPQNGDKSQELIGTKMRDGASDSTGRPISRQCGRLLLRETDKSTTAKGDLERGCKMGSRGW